MNTRQQELYAQLCAAPGQMIHELGVDKRTANALVRLQKAKWVTLVSGEMALQAITTPPKHVAKPLPIAQAYTVAAALRFCSRCGTAQPNDDDHWDKSKDNPELHMFHFVCRTCEGTAPIKGAAPVPAPKPEPLPMQHTPTIPLRVLALPELTNGDTPRIVLHYPRSGPLAWSKVVRLEAQVISVATNPNGFNAETLQHFRDQGYIVLEAAAS